MTHAYVYILASERRGTLHIGVTGNLLRAIKEHKAKKAKIPGAVPDQLVWYEKYATAEDAVYHAMAFEKWRRVWQLRLVETTNPAWEDLFEQPLRL